jgi:PAS domain S-box-containing protein
LIDSKNETKGTKKSGENYQILSDKSPFSNVLLDMDGTIIDLDKASEKLFGYKREELISKHISILSRSPSAFNKATKPLFKNVVNRKYVDPIEQQIQNKKGNLVWVSLLAFLVKIGDNECIQVIFQDVEKRVLTSHALKQSEKKYRDLAELLPDVLFEVDLTLNLTYANSIAFKKFGYSKEDFEKGFNISKIIAPEHKEKAIRNIKNIIKGNKTKPNNYTLVKKDGSQFHSVIHSSPKRENGKVVGIRGVIHDITEMVEAENKLIESEAKYRFIFEHSPFSILLIDTKGVILDCNPSTETILGYSKDELIGKKYFDLPMIPPKYKQMLIRRLKNILKGNTPPNLELELSKKDGTLFYASIQSILIEIGSKKFIEVIGFDISSIKEENRSLVELNKIKTNFLDTASHELKTPLTTVHGAIQLLYELNKDILNEESLQLIEMAKKGSQKLKNLILNLLDVSRLESNKYLLDNQLIR